MGQILDLGFNISFFGFLSSFVFVHHWTYFGGAGCALYAGIGTFFPPESLKAAPAGSGASHVTTGCFIGFEEPGLRSSLN